MLAGGLKYVRRRDLIHMRPPEYGPYILQRAQKASGVCRLSHVLVKGVIGYASIRAAGKILLAAENWFSSGGKDKKYSCAEKNFPAKCQIKKLIIIWLQILMFIFYYVHIGVNFQQCLIKYFISRISEVGVHKTLHNKLRVCNFLFAACRADTSSLN